MLINYRNEMLHDSSLYRFRDPVGALATCTPVTLRIRTSLEKVDRVYLCLFSEGFREDHLMQRSDAYWQIDITAPSVPDVYWYYFTVNLGGKLCYYGAGGRRTGGIGCVYTDPPPCVSTHCLRCRFYGT